MLRTVVKLLRIGCLAAAGLLPLSTALAETGLPVPRFVTVAASEANLRVGPGDRYPIRWVLVRPDMPIEVIGEFDVWRQVRDWEGIEGWVHQSLLSGRRSVLIDAESVVEMHVRPAADSRVLARVEPAVQGRLVACPATDGIAGGWCLAEMGGVRGWLPRAVLWGIYTDEIVD